MNETIRNLTKGFVGESQARSRYTMYARVAEEEDYPQIANVFIETANNEKEHARVFFEFLQELKKQASEDLSTIELDTVVPTIIGMTEENLKVAMEGEHYESTELYPMFADVAEKEGYPNIALRIRKIIDVESHHERRYRKLINEVKNGSILNKTQNVYWICNECGYIFKGTTPPNKCPLCGAPHNVFSIFDENCEKY